MPELEEAVKRLERKLSKINLSKEVIQKAQKAWENAIEEGDLDLKEPIRILKEALELYPNSEEIKKELVRFYDLSISDLNGKEIKLLEELIDLYPTKPQYFDDLAEMYFKKGRFNKAEAQLKRGIENIEKALREKPKDEDLLWNLMQAHVNVGDFYAREIPDISDDSLPPLPCFEEFPESERQNPSKAIQEYETALKIIEDNKFEMHYSMARYECSYCSIEEKLASLYNEKKNWRKAISLLESLVAKMTSDSDMEKAYKREVYKKIGNIFREREDYRKAIGYYEKGLAVEIKDFKIKDLAKDREAWAICYIGKCYQGIGNHRKAIETFKQAVELNPDDEDVLVSLNFGLGYSYSILNDLQEAAYYYRRTIELDPEEDAAHDNLGLVYSKLGFKDKAEKEYREAIRINPDDQTAKENLNILLGR